MNYLDAFLMMLNEMSPYLLLGFLIAGVLHAFVPQRLYGRYLSGTGWRPVTLAALFGIPLPLCSCGVLPTAVALRRSGASRAASTSFLIATPQTGVDSIAATYSMMGLPFAVLRPVAALVTAGLGGLAVGAGERDGDTTGEVCATGGQELPPTFTARVKEALRYGFVEMIQHIGKWLVIGLVVAALITVLLPDDFFTTYARYPLLNMLAIVVVAVPMYVCATGSIPIAAALMLKGMSPGCALVLLMAGPAANLASMLVVNRAFGRRAALTYLATIVAGAIGFGVLVDYWPGMRQLFASAMPHHAMAHAMEASWWSIACSVLLVALLLGALLQRHHHSHELEQKSTDMTQTFEVKGMSCGHCRATVERGIAGLDGVQRVEVDLAKGMAYVDGTVDRRVVIDRVKELGFDAR